MKREKGQHLLLFQWNKKLFLLISILFNYLVQLKNLLIIIPKDLQVASMPYNFPILKGSRKDDLSAYIERFIKLSQHVE